MHAADVATVNHFGADYLGVNCWAGMFRRIILTVDVKESLVQPFPCLVFRGPISEDILKIDRRIFQLLGSLGPTVNTGFCWHSNAPSEPEFILKLRKREDNLVHRDMLHQSSGTVGAISDLGSN